MIRNFIFLVLTIASLAWIVYAGQEMINFSGNENPERIFGQEDGRVLILNRPNEIDISSTDFRLQPRLVELFNILKANQSLDERLIISEQKAHVVIEKSQPINNDRIKLLFGDEKLLEVTSKKFLWKEFTIERNKGVLEIYIASEKSSTTDEKWYSFDKKSACSIVQFNHKRPIITDYYQKEETISSYTRSPLLTKTNKDINDKEMFASHIPVFITKYEFFEREYAIRNDPVFEESMANKWANLGLVFFEYKNHPFLLMDFVHGKEPDLFLDNYLNVNSESERHYVNLSITKDFPNNPNKGFYMRIFEDHVLFAENEEALIDLEASIELGQMLSLNKTKSKLVYGQTPKKVCYRRWTNKLKIAKSMYNGSALEVKVSSVKNAKPKPIIESPSVGTRLDSPAKLLLVKSSNDKVYALSETNTLFGMEKGKTKFKIPINESIKGKMNWSNSAENEIIITSLNHVHVIKETGEYKDGFPVKIPEGISKAAKAFTWKGNTNYVVANNSGYYVWLDQNGKQIATGKMEVTNLTAEPIVWTSQRRLFFGFHGDGNFAMVEAEKNSLLRSFPIPIGVHSSVLSNEVVFFSVEKNALYRYNQRGRKNKISDLTSGNWIKADDNADGSFYVNDGNKLLRYSGNGTLLTTLKGNFSDVDFIKRIDKTSKGSLIGVVDGMNNKVLLYKRDGKQLQLENSQGQLGFGITTVSGQSKLYTLSDKFLIHYVL